GRVLLGQALGDELAPVLVGQRWAGGVADAGSVARCPGEVGEAVDDFAAQRAGWAHELDLNRHRWDRTGAASLRLIITPSQKGGSPSQRERNSSSTDSWLSPSCGSSGPHFAKIRAISPFSSISAMSWFQRQVSQESRRARARWGVARSPHGVTRVVIKGSAPTVQVVEPSDSRTGSMRPAVLRSWCLQSRRWRLCSEVGPPRAGS